MLMDHTQWDQVLPSLPSTFTYIRPVLPLSAHRRPMNPGTDLTLYGQVNIVADFLDALDLTASPRCCPPVVTRKSQALTYCRCLTNPRRSPARSAISCPVGRWT